MIKPRSVWHQSFLQKKLPYAIILLTLLQSIGLAVNEFKGFFPTGKVPKGKSLLLVRRGRDGALLLQYEVSLPSCQTFNPNIQVLHTMQGKLLGTLESNFLSKQMMLSYFADNGKEISPKVCRPHQ